MKIILPILIFLSMSIYSSKAISKEIALSFDDAPRAATPYLNGQNRAEVLINNLAKVNVEKVILFANSSALKYEVRKSRLLKYANAGHLIANHTHSHKRPSDLGTQGYIDDILKAESYLKEFPNFVKFFRYPYLDYGKTEDLRDEVHNSLEKYEYKIGYVTIDNSDWYMDALLQKAVRSGQKVNIESLRDAYVYMLWDSIKFYDELAVKLLGRSPKHVLLLHENDLAALFIGDLVKLLRSKGWKIISPEEAYTDNLSRIKPNTLINGDGRIAAIAEAQGFAGPIRDFFQSEKEIEKYFLKKNVFH